MSCDRFARAYLSNRHATTKIVETLIVLERSDTDLPVDAAGNFYFSTAYTAELTGKLRLALQAPDCGNPQSV